ncbi:hypothetical protein D3C75_814580 [compost metagenome]
MVGEEVDLLHSAEAGGGVGDGFDRCAVGIEAGNERYPDLHRHAVLGEAFEVRDGQLHLAAGPVKETFFIHVFEIRQHQIQ